MSHTVLRFLAVSTAIAGWALPAVAVAQESTALDATIEVTASQTPAQVPVQVPVVAGALEPAPLSVFEGIVSFYGREFAGRKTSSGERFDPAALTMAHKTLPFGTLVRVTSLNNQKSVVVRVNDRGPFVGGRIGDLSAAAANALAMLQAGVSRVRLEVLDIMSRGHTR